MLPLRRRHEGSRGLALGLALLLLSLPLAAAGGRAAAAAERVALVIGNSAYRHTTPLVNPANDARAVTRALESVGFEVVAGYDMGADAMDEAVERFEKALEGAKVALVYYSGHGLGVDGVNYLVPVDAKLETKAALKREAVSADWLLGDVMEAEGRVSIVVFDACRNNPLTRSFATRTRSAVGSGLAEMRARTGSYFAFATAPGDVASDGAGANSPFTEAFLRHVATPGLEIDGMMKLVRRDVYEATGKDQLPWTNSALLGEFYFVPPAGGGDGPAVAAAATAPPPPAVVAALPPPQETVLRVQPVQPAAPTPAPAPAQPSAEELRLSALQRVENALLQSEGARRNVQRDLAALGHLSGRADGRFGPGTRDAVRGFQAVAKLEPSGYVDRPTLDALRAQVARLRPAEEEPRPARPPKQPPPPQQARPEPEPAPAADPPPPAPVQQRAYSAMTIGVCTTPGGGWASERHLTYAQCRKLGGSFEPF
jgi:hypothetical protein